MTHTQYMRHLRALAIASHACPEATVDMWLGTAGIFRASEAVAVQLWLARRYDETLAWFLSFQPAKDVLSPFAPETTGTQK